MGMSILKKGRGRSWQSWQAICYKIAAVLANTCNKRKMSNVELRMSNIEVLAMITNRGDRPSAFEIQSSTFDIHLDCSANRSRMAKQLHKISRYNGLNGLLQHWEYQT
jgi:hypothetical protein